MPSYTHFRPGAAGARRAFPAVARRAARPRCRALRRRACAKRTRCRSAAAPSPARPTRSTSTPSPAISGFARVVDNSMDASSDRDFAATFLYACAMTMVHLSRLAEDMIILCGDEHRFFELSDALSTGSSMMPQKKNPDPLELVRGKTGRTLGHLVAHAHDAEGPADRLQQGSAGGQGSRLRRGGHAGRLPGGCPIGGQGADAQPRARGGCGIRACCWRPTLPTIWSAAACRSGARTKSSAVWCASWSRSVAIFRRSRLDEWRAASDKFEADIRDRMTPGSVGGGQADAPVHGAGGRPRPPRRRAEVADWTGTMLRSFRLSHFFPRQRTLGRFDAAAPASAW